MGDSVTRVLHVEPEGELHLEENSYVLDTDGKEGRTLEIPGDIPDGIIPDGEFSVSIRVTVAVGCPRRLTALVLRVLALARPYLPLAAGGPGTSLRWLLGQQRPDGAFHESEPVLHREMQVGTQGWATSGATSRVTFMVISWDTSRLTSMVTSLSHLLV
ncbi:complement c4 [Limosa lapponica baueri]|uniref:Complement c4 n=1 Tax=Limosa lapponica baueri TaxID=1758121 RepID=A0A2I0T1Q2_LIMLA|nr:complement c4 [Limosa lapponica baueri]